MAAFAGDTVVDRTLVHLMLDLEDSDVTSETVQALLARGDADGMRLVAEAFASDDGGWLDFSIRNVLRSSDENSSIVALCRSLTGDQDELVRRGARELVDVLSAPDFGWAAERAPSPIATPEGGVSTWRIEPWEPGT